MEFIVICVVACGLFVKFGGIGHPHRRAVWEGMVFLPEQNCLRGSSAPL